MKYRKSDRFIRNVRWIQLNNENLYAEIENKTPDPNRVREVALRSGTMILEVKKDEEWHSLYSKYSPEREVQRWVQQLKLNRVKEIILFGVGLGYHLEELLEKVPDMKVYIFEPDMDVFLKALDYIDLTSDIYREQIVLLHAGNMYGFISKFINYIYNELPMIQVLPVYHSLYSSDIAKFFECLKENLKNYRFSFRMYVAFDKIWVLNSLVNLQYTISMPSVEVLKPYIEGKPVVIVSSGPSLENEIERLRGIRDHIFIFASGTALNGLLKHGIVPHAVISYDPQVGNKKAFDLMVQYMDELQVDVPFIFGSTLYHEILSEYHNKFPVKYHALISMDPITPHVQKQLLSDNEKIYNDSPSVAIFNLQIAKSLGANPIIFVGQDLAVPNKRFYSSGVSKERSDTVSDEELELYFETEQVGGGQVLTSPSFNMMRKNMEVYIEGYKNQDPNAIFINVSSEGARINHTVEKSLDDVIAEYVDLTTTFYNPLIQQFNQNRGEYSEEKLKEKLTELFATQQKLDSYMLEIEHLLDLLDTPTINMNVEKHLREIDIVFEKLQRLDSFLIVYKHMLSVQLNLYLRFAVHVKEEKPTIEKGKKVAERLRHFIKEYKFCKSLLQDFNIISREGE